MYYTSQKSLTLHPICWHSELNTPIYIKMHDALFSSYLVLEEGPIVLEISGRIKSKYQISKTISVPFYLKKQVKCILDQIHTINILIGNQSIYMSIPIPLRQQTITESD